MKINRLLPFWMRPTCWFTSGKARLIAEAEYYNNGEDLERRIAEIECDGQPGTHLLSMRFLEIERKYGRLTNYEYEKRVAALENPDEPEQSLALLEIEFRYKKIGNFEYQCKVLELTIEDPTELAEKRLEVEWKTGRIGEKTYRKNLATLHKEPWVDTPVDFDPSKGLQGFSWEWDWNEFFIQFLEENGYKGRTESEIVESYFNDICIQVAEEAGVLDNLIDQAFDEGEERPIRRKGPDVLYRSKAQIAAEAERQRRVENPDAPAPKRKKSTKSTESL
jgi:hypothetical protein